jgi:putative tricarboxylic transport membrane protein
MMRKRLILATVLVGMALASAFAAGYLTEVQAAAFPARNIDYIVPFAPGGGSGITAEVINKIIVENKLSPQPWVINYKPGANGMLGWAALAARKGDNYAVATTSTSFSTGIALKQSTIQLKDFTPIAGLVLDGILAVTASNSPYKSLKEIVAAAKKAPRSIKVAGTGSAGSDAIATALLEKEAGIKLNQIPFNSGAEVNAAILGGHVDLAFSNPNEFLPNIEAGKLRPLAVCFDQRLPVLKDVPTMKELGYGIVRVMARGLVAPAGIGAAERAWYVSVMQKVAADKAWKKYADDNCMLVKFLGGDDYKKFLEEEEVNYTAIFKMLGVLK